MQFTWDERKNRINKHKHGISFETAVLAFDDANQVSRCDRTVEDEYRWQTIGMVKGIHVLVVANADQLLTRISSEPNEEEEESLRIISARKATPRERRVYAEGIKEDHS